MLQHGTGRTLLLLRPIRRIRLPRISTGLTELGVAVGVIVRPALRITCQRDNPRQKATWPFPDLHDPQRRRAARLGFLRTVPSPCAVRNLQSPHLVHCPGHRGRAVSCQSSDQHAVQAVAPIHPRLVRTPRETREGTTPGARRPCLATARLTRPPSGHRGRGASPVWPVLTASGLSEEGR